MRCVTRAWARTSSCLLPIVFFALGSSTWAQAPTTEFKPLHPFERPGSLRIESDGKARELVALILRQYGLKLEDSDWEIWITDDTSETPNAAANFTTKRQIFFNRAFMDRISRSRDDNWTLYAITAHELAHHLGNHVLRPGLNRQRAEREADYHAGFVIGRMGAAYDSTIDVVRWLPGSEGTGYPSRAQRLCEIGRGWRDAKRLEPIPSFADGAQVCEDRQLDTTKFALRRNRDIYGQDIMTAGSPGISGIDLAACAARCEELAACKAFSFDRWLGKCYLKNNIVESVVDPPSIIGAKIPHSLPNVSKTAPGKMEIVRNRRFRDNPRENVRTFDNFDMCLRHCDGNSDCVAFSYVKPSRACWTFDRTVGHYIDDLADSGYKRQDPTQSRSR